MKKKKIMSFVIICGLFLLTGCSSKEVYHDDNMTAYFEENVEDRLDLSIDFKCSTATLPESTVQTLLTFNPVYESFEIELSDGMIYGYVDGTLDDSGNIYMKAYSSLAELEKDLNMDVISSSDIVYPEDGNNLVLQYHPDDMIFINFASAKTSTGDVSSIQFQILLKGRNPNPDKPEKFILYISPLCYSKEKGGFPLCYLRINTLTKFTASLPVMTA